MPADFVQTKQLVSSVPEWQVPWPSQWPHRRQPSKGGDADLALLSVMIPSLSLSVIEIAGSH
jgi:hypothetical protein